MFENVFLRRTVLYPALICLMTAFLFSLQAMPSAASSTEDSFIEDIRNALQSGDQKNFWKLFNMEGVDETVKVTLKKHLADPLMKAKLLKVSLLPLPEDFHTEYVVDGIRYKPNVVPLGLVEFQYNRAGRTEKSTTKMLYGKKGDRLMLAGTIAEKLPGKFAPSKQIQVIVMGMGHPAVTFDGYMTYLQGGKPVRDNLKDMGSGNLTRVVRGEAFIYLEVRRTSANGTLKVIVMEDQETLFETDNLDTAKPIIFKK